MAVSYAQRTKNKEKAAKLYVSLTAHPTREKYDRLVAFATEHNLTTDDFGASPGRLAELEIRYHPAEDMVLATRD